MKRLERHTGGRRSLGEIQRADCPRKGVYFFFEKGEIRSGSGTGDRIVRVGSHAFHDGQCATLWSRIKKHQGAQRPEKRQRSSVFRNRVGNAVCRQDSGLGPRNWPKDADRGDSARIEKRINRRMWPMTALLLPVGCRTDRGYIERNGIDLLSEYGKAAPIDPASEDWLGHWCNRKKVKQSGLWQSNHVDDQYDPGFLELLEEYVDRTGD